MRFAVRGLLLLGLLPAAAAMQPSPLDAVLARMRHADPGLWSGRIIGTPRSTPGLALSTQERGYRFALRQCAGGLCNGTYFDGTSLAHVTLNGTTVYASPRNRPDLRMLNGVRTLVFLAPDFAGTVRLAAAGAKTATLEVQMPRSDPASVTVDRARGVAVRARDDRTGTVYEFSHFRKIGADLLPFDIDRDGIPLERYTKRAVDDGNVAPSEAPALTLAPNAALSLTTPGILPIGDCRIAGIKTRCLLDTGNTGLAMSVQLANALDIRPIGSLSVAALGRYGTTVVRAGPLQAGGLTLGTATYALLPGIHRLGYDIVIGADVLARVPFEIDERQRTVRFGPMETHGETTPFRVPALVPEVAAIVDGIPATLAVDTGDEAAVNVSPAFYQAHRGILTGPQGAEISGAGSSTAATSGVLSSLTIAGSRFTNVPALETPLLSSPPDGDIGSGLLWRYAVYVDYRRFTLVLTQP